MSFEKAKRWFDRISGQFHSNEFEEMRDICLSSIQKASQYKELEERGMLLELPCPLQTQVFEVVSTCKGDPFECDGVKCGTCPHCDQHIEVRQFTLDCLKDFNKWIFLTEEEANKKLQELA